MGNKTNFDLGFVLQPPRLAKTTQDQHYGLQGHDLQFRTELSDTSNH